MKFGKETLNLEEGLKREWIITNGIGGYAASSIISANTRKYHGLLVAPMVPPARRYVILSKVDESITIGNDKFDLYTNLGKEYTSQGYRYLEKFRKDFLPVFTYKVKDVEITKMICMEYGKNTVGIYYKIKNKSEKAKLTLAPIMNFRDVHTVNNNNRFNLEQSVKGQKVKVIIDGNAANPIYMKLSGGTYIEHKENVFYNMFYLEEENRGFYPFENHAVTGVYEIDIQPNEDKEISFVCSLEDNIDEINVKHMINNEIIRLNTIFNNSMLINNRNQDKSKYEQEIDEIKKTFMIATDNFVVYRPSFGLHTLIAGYPWFLDWGRDSLISFEGLLLKTRRFDIAKEVLLTYTRDIKKGLVPNGYSGFDNRPLYNSADSSLLLFEQVKKFLDYTADYKFIQDNIYDKLKNIIDNYEKGIDVDDNNIYLDLDGLIVYGTDKTQHTWMDAKYGDFAVTPRNGKAVEINSLWYNALMIMKELTIKFSKMGQKGLADRYTKLANKCKKSFEDKFYNGRRKSLYDVLGDNKIRPNQLFAMSLTYPIIDPSSEIAKNILATVEKKLLNNYGLKTLAKGEENYVDVYTGDSFRRDMSYHQGITWPWLLGLYYNVLRNMILAEKNKTKRLEYQEKLRIFKETTRKTFKKEINEKGCIGSISELYDSRRPQEPKGTFAQAWSVAEIFRIIL